MPVHILGFLLHDWMQCDQMAWTRHSVSLLLTLPSTSPNTHPHPTVLLASSTDTFTSHLPSVFLSLWLPNQLWLFLFECGVLLVSLWVSFISWTAVGASTHGGAWLNTRVPFAGEICGFRIHGQNVPFEAVVLDKSTGEGLIRAKDKLDCELQKEHTFTIQAYDCGEGPDGGNMKKSHKCVSGLAAFIDKIESTGNNGGNGTRMEPKCFT